MTRFRAALITGAGSGLGRALAERLAEPGVTLVLTGRDAARLEHCAAACRAGGATVEALVLDVADAAAMQAALTEADCRLRFDLVIANAGIARGREDAAFARQTVQTNVLGVLNTVAPLIDEMAARGSGQVGIVSSLSAFRALGGPPGYAASKAWARLYGEALRGRYASRGVGVSVICPGFIDTPMVAEETRARAGPRLVSAPVAAGIILRGLDRNAARISFPRAAALEVWWLASAPVWWTDRHIRKRWRMARVGGRGKPG
jgi:NADP-dependent 3-hydroxy acid dehydrogenase YdfG